MHTRRQRELRTSLAGSRRDSRPQTAASVAPSGCPRGGVSPFAWPWAPGADLEPGDTALRPHRPVPWSWTPPSCGAFIQTGAVSPRSSAGRTPRPGLPGTPELGGCVERGVLTSVEADPCRGGHRACAARWGGVGRGRSLPWKLALPLTGSLLALTWEDA